MGGGRRERGERGRRGGGGGKWGASGARREAAPQPDVEALGGSDQRDAPLLHQIGLARPHVEAPAARAPELLHGGADEPDVGGDDSLLGRLPLGEGAAQR